MPCPAWLQPASSLQLQVAGSARVVYMLVMISSDTGSMKLSGQAFAILHWAELGRMCARARVWCVCALFSCLFSWRFLLVEGNSLSIAVSMNAVVVEFSSVCVRALARSL